MLGFRDNLRAERVEQEPEWLVLSGRVDTFVSAAHAQSTSHPKIAIALEYAGFPGDRRALAHSCRPAKSKSGRSQRLSLVLFRKRTVHALSGKRVPPGY